MGLGNLKVVNYEQQAPELPAQNIGQTIAKAAIAVHVEIGSGLGHNLYRECLVHELEQQGMKVAVDVPFNVEYKGKVFENALVADLVVEGCVMVMVAAEPKVPEHKELLRTALMHSKLLEGFLVNFHVPEMRNGIMHAAVKTGNVFDNATPANESVN